MQFRVLFKSIIVAAVVIFLAGATGCANAPKYSQMNFPPLATGQGRIFIFRDGFPLGFAIQPDVKVNDQVVGKSIPNNFFFIDRPAGHYKVSCMTEWQHDADIDLAANQTLYVQTHIAPGVVVGHVWPELIPAEKALPILKDSTYSGPPIPQTAATIGQSAATQPSP